MKLNGLLIAAVAVIVACSCVRQAPVGKAEPEVYVSIGADANFLRFSSQDSITHYLEECRDAGFNHIVLDVKPNYGKVLYRSDYLTYLD